MSIITKHLCKYNEKNWIHTSTKWNDFDYLKLLDYDTKFYHISANWKINMILCLNDWKSKTFLFCIWCICKCTNNYKFLFKRISNFYTRTRNHTWRFHTNEKSREHAAFDIHISRIKPHIFKNLILLSRNELHGTSHATNKHQKGALKRLKTINY